MSEIEVTVAAPDERATLENLLQLYIHDFSEHWAGRPDGEIGEDGRFAPYPLDAYWNEPDHVPLLLRAHGHPVGFALLDRTSHTGHDLDRNMREFFILRKHRRSGVGTAAARAIFSLYPGRWEAAIARPNAAALPFWRKAVAGHPLAEDVVESDENTPVWNGAVIRFRIR
ncbi:MAG: family N-acetyltransferase [Sphingomonas bacterium]|uniref:GNAT family N-acetyltransferase n=1 Tax=Sphingomonas bacterium TaxID=1895847 RepID=UPI00262D460D|nr:GNAT family N-acetyltransferase [Sphingomonas bacterium]MDB5704778.1 family N-acetyltransferase [Sphingomonas bacterium]